MGKALMVSGTPATGRASGEELNLFGFDTDSTAELNTQASCTEGATFTGLGYLITAGGSGTNNLRFRDAGADGNQLATRSGTGLAEDTTNSDTLSAGDLFNLAYTDTGTDATVAWTKGNVEFASGHGNFHGSARFGGAVFDAASATRFIQLAGNHSTDGNVTEDNAAFKIRGYDSFEAFQVRVTANARANDSVFRNRINSSNGTGVITFATGATGLVSDTGLGDAITDGQTVCVSITLDTGVQDLTVTFVVATLKSSTSKSDQWAGLLNISRTASATANYISIGGAHANLTALTEADARIKPGFAAVVSNLRCYLSANTYTGDGTLKLYQNGSAVITTTITASGGAGWYENTSDTITIDADDELSFEFDEGTSGSITIWMTGITFAPVAEGGGTILPQMMQHGLFLGMRT